MWEGLLTHTLHLRKYRHRDFKHFPKVIQVVFLLNPYQGLQLVFKVLMRKVKYYSASKDNLFSCCVATEFYIPR